MFNIVARSRGNFSLREEVYIFFVLQIYTLWTAINNFQNVAMEKRKWVFFCILLHYVCPYSQYKTYLELQKKSAMYFFILNISYFMYRF